MKNICYSFLMGILLFFGTNLFAQENTISYFDNDFETDFYKPSTHTLKQCIELSDAVFEGIVTKQEVLKKDTNSDSTYTITHVEVTKVFKGKVDKNVITIYPGGTLKNPNTQQLEGTSSWFLNSGAVGVFFTKKTNIFSEFSQQRFKFLRLRDLDIYLDYGNIKEMEEWIQVVNKSIDDELEQSFYKELQEITNKKYKKYKKVFSVKPKKEFCRQKGGNK